MLRPRFPGASVRYSSWECTGLRLRLVKVVEAWVNTADIICSTPSGVRSSAASESGTHPPRG